jgi:hypothetical protein
MITVKLMGGMGNQMFQYALGRTLSLKNNDSLILDLNFLLDRRPRPNFTFRDFDLVIFDLKVETILSMEKLDLAAKASYSKILSKLHIDQLLHYLPRMSYVIGDNNPTKFNPKILNLKGNIYLNGYWQSPKYFSSITEIIKRDFSIKKEFIDENSDIANLIKNTNSVCVNVRRTDFITNPEAAKYHGSCSLDFYQEAAKIITKQVDKPHFIVTSDDIDWCRDNLKFDLPTTYIGHEYSGYKFANYLWLITQCKHFIIPNSSFAWWGAWLSENREKIVIVPKNWFNDPRIDTSDLIPTDWIRI